MLKQDLDEIKKLRKLVDELVSEAEHKQITDAVLKLKHDGISPETWVMLGIDHGQIFLMRKIYWQICENSALKSQLAAALKDLQTERERIVKLLDGRKASLEEPYNALNSSGKARTSFEDTDIVLNEGNPP